MSNQGNGWHRQEGGIAMFDKLIESDTVGAEFKSRRRYFLISSVVVGLLFISAVVISLYATDIGLGNDSYELATLVAPPVEPPAEAPEPPQPQQRTIENHTTDIPMRIVRQRSIEEPPTTVPPVSTTPNQYQSIPSGLYKIGPVETNPSSPFGSMSDRPTGSGGDNDSRQVTNIDPRPESISEPPPPPPAEPKRLKTLGVINGYAVSLPKPPYPSPAVAVNAQGKVDVQVTIDEDGKVISAKAVSGHPLLRGVSEDAARKARFQPTLLSKVPVKVTGVIVYNFTRN